MSRPECSGAIGSVAHAFREGRRATIEASLDEVRPALEDVEAQGLLGCFALTEKLAGVQSGLVVETTAEYDAAAREFVLQSPHAPARADD